MCHAAAIHSHTKWFSGAFLVHFGCMTSRPHKARCSPMQPTWWCRLPSDLAARLGRMHVTFRVYIPPMKVVPGVPLSEALRGVGVVDSGKLGLG